MLIQTPARPNGAAPAAGAAAPAPRRGSGRRLIVILAVLLLAAGAAAAAILLRPRGAPAYVTVAVTTGPLTQSVTASGVVNPRDTISVGTQVSGTIATLYVDYNSRVRQGQVLAQIDPSQFQAQLAQARAALVQAEAQASAGTFNASAASYGAAASNQSILAARESLQRARAADDLARRTLARDDELLRQGYVARSQYDADYSAAVAAATTLRSAQATLAQTQVQALQASAGANASGSSASGAAASVEAARAVVQQDELNLQRTTIVSPVNGTVIARNVSVGQTVAASFQTPTLFSIARNLRKMEADIAVGEPDIGNVRPGQSVGFTVLAYPNRTFHGTVSQVRENPTTIANVVTYTVVVLVSNDDNALFPGMTANAAISVATVAKDLLVPVQALQFRIGTAGTRGAPASPWGQTGADVSGAVVAGARRSVYVLRDGKPVRERVRVDLVNGTTAAVKPLGDLKKGDLVIVSSGASPQRQTGAANPAMNFGRMVR